MKLNRKSCSEKRNLELIVLREEKRLLIQQIPWALFCRFSFYFNVFGILSILLLKNINESRNIKKKTQKTAYLFYQKCFFWVSQCLTVYCYWNNHNSQVVGWNLTIYCQIQGMPASAPFIRMGLMSISLWNCRALGDSVWRREVWGAGIRSTQEGLTSPILQGICMRASNPSRIACSSAPFWLPTRLLQLMTAREAEMSRLCWLAKTSEEPAQSSALRAAVCICNDSSRQEQWCSLLWCLIVFLWPHPTGLWLCLGMLLL